MTPDQPKTPRRSTRSGLVDSVLGTRNLMTVAALSVVGLIILIPLSYLTPAGGASQDAVWLGVALLGLWVIPYLLPCAVVQRPGAALLASLILGVAGTFTTPAGPMSIVGNLIGGLMIEIPLAVMAYRTWKWWIYLIPAAFFGASNALMYIMLIKQALGITVTGPIVAIGTISALVGALAVVGLTRLLNKAGVGVTNRG